MGVSLSTFMPSFECLRGLLSIGEVCSRRRIRRALELEFLLVLFAFSLSLSRPLIPSDTEYLACVPYYG